MDKNKKMLAGIVVSDKMDKSRVVAVDSKKKHPLYGKYVKTRKKYMIHDEENKSNVGDLVSFTESAPISKRKKFTLVEVLQRSEG